jgi:hypothetical protein
MTIYNYGNKMAFTVKCFGFRDKKNWYCCGFVEPAPTHMLLCRLDSSNEPPRARSGDISGVVEFLSSMEQWPDDALSYTANMTTYPYGWMPLQHGVEHNI